MLVAGTGAAGERICLQLEATVRGVSTMEGARLAAAHPIFAAAPCLSPDRRHTYIIGPALIGLSVSTGWAPATGGPLQECTPCERPQRGS